MHLLELSHICKTHNHEPTLQDICLNLDRGEILCLLGPSGCGKTTLLRIISGLEEADSGSVVFEGRNLSGVAPHQRQFCMMFQEFALFPHKNVFQNVAFGLQMQQQNKPEITGRVREILSLVGLEKMEKRRVNELSGGERQRVALARSLAPHPRLLMLDEPMGSLDRALRERLTQDLRLILNRLGVTAIFVTHDQAEAFAVADLIAVFNAGRIEQIDKPENIYKYPANSMVARFLGHQNLLPGIITEKGEIQTDIGLLPLGIPKQHANEKRIVLIRPEAARLLKEDSVLGQKETLMTGRISHYRFQGANFQMTVQNKQGVKLVFNLANDLPPPKPGQEIRLGLSPTAMVTIPVD